QFLPPGTSDPAAWSQVRAEGYSGGNAGSVQTFYFLRERLAPGATTPALDELDAVIVLSPRLSEEKIYPCIDPLASRSRVLDPARPGRDRKRWAPARRSWTARTMTCPRRPSASRAESTRCWRARGASGGCGRGARGRSARGLPAGRAWSGTRRRPPRARPAG